MIISIANKLTGFYRGCGSVGGIGLDESIETKRVNIYIFTGICVFRGIFRVMCVFLNMSSFDS